MAFVQLPIEIIKAPNLTAGEKIAYAAIMNFKYDDNKSYIGSYQLADFLGVKRQGIKRLIDGLASKKYIEIKPRTTATSKQLSNEILLTYERGFLAAVGGVSPTPQQNQNDSAKGNQNDSAKGNQNDSAKGNQNDSGGNQNDSAHIDNIFKKPYLNLKSKRENHFDSATEQLATADITAVRSMPEPDKSGGNQQKEVPNENQLDICDSEIVSAIMPVINGFTHMFELFRVGGQYGLRPMANIGAFRAKGEELREAVQAAAASRGRVLTYLPKCDRFENEIIINFYNYSKGAA